MTTFEVNRIVKQVEDVYIAAHKRAAGLLIQKQVMELVQDVWARPAFIDSAQWMCNGLRDNKTK